jgi:hypothetical protein
MKTWTVVALAILLVGTNAWWLYSSIDQGVTAAHRSSQQEVDRRAAELLASLMTTMPKDKGPEDTYRLLLQEYPNEVVKVSGDSIQIGPVVLVFTNDTLAHVAFF